jgi:hypothetical protein
MLEAYSNFFICNPKKESESFCGLRCAGTGITSHTCSIKVAIARLDLQKILEIAENIT